MGRRQTKVSAFKVFQSRNTKNNDFDQIKSSEHQIKKIAIYKGKKKSKKDDFSDHTLSMSVTHKRKSRCIYEESSTTNDEFVESVSNKNKRKLRSISGENLKCDLTAEDISDKSLESVPVSSAILKRKKNEELLKNKLKREKKEGNISTSDVVKNDTVLKKITKKKNEYKTRSKNKNVSENSSSQNNLTEMFSNKSVKRKHKDELLEQNVVDTQEDERKDTNKKRRLSGRIKNKNTVGDERVCNSKKTVSWESVDASEKLDDATHEEDDDDQEQMVPEIIDVDVTDFPSALQIKDDSNKVRRPTFCKKLRKIKSTGDINRPAIFPKMFKNTSFSTLIEKDKSSVVSKWKTTSRTSHEIGLKCSSSLSFQPECFDLDESISKEVNNPNVTSGFSLSKLAKTKGEPVKSKALKELEVLSDDSTVELESETELSISNELSFSEDMKTTLNLTETWSDGSCSFNDDDEEEEDTELVSSPAQLSVNNVIKPCSEPGILALKTKDGGVLLLLSHPQKLCLQGRAQVKALHGSVCVMKYNITADTPECRVFSPSSNSLLTLETTSGASLAMLKPDINRLSRRSCSLEDFDSKSNDVFVLLKINSMHSACLDFLSTIAPYTNLFSLNLYPLRDYNKVLKSVGLAVSSPDTVLLSVLSISDSYSSSIDKWVNLIKCSAKAPVVVVCAGKNCGKSTAARMLVNAALNVTKEVCFLECDVGQSELTPSGCISLHKLTEPLLGPPFTHQREAQSVCFFGGLTPSDNPSLYVTQLQYVYEFYKKMQPSVPLIVNTMGWTEGLGLCLLMDTIHITTPSLVIQLDSASKMNNFKPITPEYVAEEQGWFFSNKTIYKNGGPKHELFKLESLSDNMQSVILNWKPVDHRNMSLLAALSSCIQPGMTLNSLTPYTVSWSAIGVHICHCAVKASQVLCALNASVVALCEANLSQAHRSNEDSPWLFDKIPVCQYLGLGIVRGIDMELKELYIITPLSSERLAHVNTILKGNHMLPDNVLTGQKSTGFIPYVDKVVMTKTAAKFRSRRIARR